MIASDYRLGFLDVNATILFGTLDNTTASSSRLLHTKYLKRTKKYREELLEKFKQQKLLKGMMKLAELAAKRGRWSAKVQIKYENMDKMVTEIMLQAE